MNLARYNKAILASATAAVEIVNLVLPQTNGNTRAVLGAVVAVIGAVAVYWFPNYSDPHSTLVT